MDTVIWFPRSSSEEPTPRWGGHKGRVYFNHFPLSIVHLDWLSASSQSHGSLANLTIYLESLEKDEERTIKKTKQQEQ
jgi:hypothetical protein